MSAIAERWEQFSTVQRFPLLPICSHNRAPTTPSHGDPESSGLDAFSHAWHPSSSPLDPGLTGSGDDAWERGFGQYFRHLIAVLDQRKHLGAPGLDGLPYRHW